MKLFRRLRALVRREQADTEMAEEMRTHLELLARHNLARGLSPEAARVEATRCFGGVERIQERCREERIRGLVWLEQLGQDVRYALRSFARHPGFTAVILISLALGIGANAAIFSLLDAVLWKMLPVAQPEQLVFLERTIPRKFSGLSWPLMEALERREPRLAGVTTGRTAHGTLRASTDAGLEPIKTLLVADDFFSLLGVGPALGRVLQPGDVRSVDRVAVLSHGFWQRRFGGADLIGTTILLNGTPHTVVGVAAREFFGFNPGETFDVCAPLDAADLQGSGAVTDPGAPQLSWVIGRLKPGVTPGQASGSLTTLLQQMIREEKLADVTPERIAQQRIEVRPASQGLEELRRRFSQPLLALMALVGLVLAITCANVANLLLARGAARGREMAIRASVGAGRARLCRQLVTESVTLAAAGGALGLLLAQVLPAALVRLAASNSQAVGLEARLDHRALLFTAAISILTGLVFGLAPAWSAARAGVAAVYGRAKPAGGSLSRTSRMLMTAQIALCVVLVAGAGLFVRTLRNLENFDPGFRRDQLLLVRVDPQLAGLRGATVADLYAQILERIRALPGVAGATLERNQPLSGAWTVNPVAPAGYVPPDGQPLATRVEEVGPRFFETLGIPLLAGRDFRASDDRQAPRVVAINEAAAREFFPGRNALGQRLGPQDDPTRAEIVAIAADARHASVRELPKPLVYLPVLQMPNARDTVFFIRSAADPAVLAPRVRQIIHQANPNLPVMEVTTLDAVAARALMRERLLATLAGGFGGLALTLAVVGLGGVLLFAVARRTPEIGVRMALGATRSAVVGMVLREALLLAGAGLVLGIPAAIATGRLAEGLFFGLRATDPVTLGLAAAILAIAAVAAALWPASRAARVDPMIALRTE